MPLGTEERLGLGDIVLDGDSTPQKKGAQQPPLFSPCLLWPNGWMDQDTSSYEGIGLGPGDIVLDGDPAFPMERGTAAVPHFPAHVYCGQTVAQLGNCSAVVNRW